MMKRVYLSFLLPLFFLAMTSSLLAQKIDPALGKPDPNGKIIWYDCKNLAIEGKGWTDTKSFYDRLPAKAEPLVTNNVWNLSRLSAGICVRFHTDSPTILVRWNLLSDSFAMPHMPATGVSGIDLYSRGKRGKYHFMYNAFPTTTTLNTKECEVRQNPEYGPDYLIYLPLYNGVKSVEIGIPKDQTISKAPFRQRPIVFYGTSITQGGCASRPGLAAAAIVGRNLDVPVINLGFSGSGKMEIELANLLAELDPQVYVIDCMWNMSPEEVSQRVQPFVKKLRQARPHTPILLVEGSSFMDITPFGNGKNLREEFEKLKKGGIEDIFFLSNKGMIGTDFEGTVDGCHHNDLGMMRQATVFTNALKPILKEVAGRER